MIDGVIYQHYQNRLFYKVEGGVIYFAAPGSHSKWHVSRAGWSLDDFQARIDKGVLVEVGHE